MVKRKLCRNFRNLWDTFRQALQTHGTWTIFSNLSTFEFSFENIGFADSFALCWQYVNVNANSDDLDQFPRCSVLSHRRFIVSAFTTLHIRDISIHDSDDLDIHLPGSGVLDYNSQNPSMPVLVSAILILSIWVLVTPGLFDCYDFGLSSISSHKDVESWISVSMSPLSPAFVLIILPLSPTPFRQVLLSQ